MQALFESLQRGGRGVASSRRLARQIEWRYAQWQTAKGEWAWPAPRVAACDDWLQQIWQSDFQHDPGAPALLSEEQELALWEQVIRRSHCDGGARPLMQLAGTARAARQSWRRLHEWRLSREQLGERASADTSAFLGWSEALQGILRDRHWLTLAELPGYLAEHHHAWGQQAGEALWWMGFDALPAVHERIRERLESQGIDQRRFDNPGRGPARAALIECGGVIEQWRRIAGWARGVLEADPAASVGVVCPDLHGRREEVEEILEDVLHPELAWRSDAPRTFHLSLGRPLPEYPVAGTALDLLHWQRPRIPFDTVSRVLRSPYLAGGDSELAARAALEAHLRNRQQASFTLAALRRQAARHDGLTRFVRCLDAAAERPRSDAQEPSGWAAELSRWLGLFGWPGERSLDSRELQVVKAWQQLLSRFASLNIVADRWRREEAMSKLASMASARVLQFHDDEAPVQVMGVAEAAGMWFDALWLADMNDASWPPPVRPDPFIPVAVQKAGAMPGASAASVMEQARARTRHLLASAAHVTVSFARVEDDLPAALSPLFEGCVTRAAPDSGGAAAGRTRQLLAAAPLLETLADAHAPPLAAGRLQGGVSVLADQALCPFRALAHHRLHARELEPVAPGLNAAQRGELTHEALACFWARVGSQQALLAMDEARLTEHITACVAGVLGRRSADSPFQARLLGLESERLSALLREWLALECRREPFRVVATESARQVTLGDTGLDVRVDRIDELGDGRWLIIDYKTGQLANPRVWTDERIEEPQLPLYALALDEPLAALAFAAVRRGACGLRGIADSDVTGLPSLQPVSTLEASSITALKPRWAAALGELAAAHREGAAAVDPKHVQACRYCDVMPLCRVFERPGSPG